MADSDDVFAGQLRLLTSMGFTNPDENRKALRITEGKLYAAVELIVSGKVDETPEPSASILPRSRSPLPTDSSPPTPTPPPGPRYKFPSLTPDKQHLMFQLHSMGFKDEGKRRHALHISKWEVEQAAVLLLEKSDELDSGFSGTLVDAAGARLAVPGLGRAGGGGGGHVRSASSSSVGRPPVAVLHSRSASSSSFADLVDLAPAFSAAPAPVRQPAPFFPPEPASSPFADLNQATAGAYSGARAGPAVGVSPVAKQGGFGAVQPPVFAFRPPQQVQAVHAESDPFGDEHQLN
ncbi:hypothetical protein BDK51DRAFT_29826 [Blyttiomyces helicus]|uniref:UBA domain-containing protein n=1 Tax=Blyttiomyces helicus TaxID=388810 RepID=A0A4P9WJY9_9FUNG|nr:hypothetical protein BDK51DRAFT_29826 [Blyttiomyces helicus]|eukprot:RKO90986.1 hypothetical protein BDK51DRAFT_29826 [Blyttiomyces helicus]